MSISSRKIVLRIAGFILSIMLTFTSIMLMRKSELLIGGSLLVVSATLFLLSVRAIEMNPISDEELDVLRPYLIPLMFFIATLTLSAVLVVNITDYARTALLDRTASVEWLLSILSLT